MNAIIEKTAVRDDSYRRMMWFYPSARAAFKDFLRAVEIGPEERVLLPAYIGWSAREGSGVFDPISELGLTPAFYRMDDRLHIDLESFGKLLKAHKVRVAVLIHYFGYPDSEYATAVAMAKEAGALVLEDEAHAMYTDLIGGATGRLGHASIFSLHKMLPVKEGGMLVVNSGCERIIDRIDPPGVDIPSPWSYDLVSIARMRVNNAATLADMLVPLAGVIDPLWEAPAPGVVSQTYPVLVSGVSRDKLYFAMNEAGYGAVSLYHTMIDRITSEDFPESHYLSKHVMNLPVHQDTGPEQLRSMVDKLVECVREMGGKLP